MGISSRFIFGGRSSDDLGLLISGSGIYPTPERDAEIVEVPGRNGNLVFDNGRYKNVTITYDCLIRDFETNYDSIRTFFASQVGYQRLEDSYQPDRYRMARISGQLEPTVGPYKRNARIKLSFDCKPQVRFKSGDITVLIKSGDTLYNRYGFSACPLIRVHGSGTLQIGSYAVAIADPGTPYVDLDCETMDAFYGARNLNGSVTLENFPQLVPGSNGIKYDGKISAVEITPRWWTL